MKKQVLTFLSLAGTDLLALGAAVSLGLFLRGFLLPRISPVFADQPPLQPEYLWLFAIALGVFAYEGLYARRRTAWEELRYIVRGVGVAFILFLALMTILKQGSEVSRPAIVMAFVAAPLFLIGGRLGTKNLLRKSRFWPRRVLVAGCNPEALQLAGQLQSFPELGFDLFGFLCEEGEDPWPMGTNRGLLDDLEKVAAEGQVDEIIVAIPQQSRLRQFEILTRAEALVPKVAVLPELFDADKLNVEIDKVERYFLLSFQNNLMKRSNRLIKSCFEIVALLVSLPLWAPLMLALGFAVKISSSGPVFFRQRRVGKGGREFSCIKFRTMVEDAAEQLERCLEENPDARAEWEAERKLKQDPRVTSVGHFLRRTSLDELPQIFNVLRGDMSLIGPRPIVADEIDHYEQNFKYYASVCPGLSGLWQVSGRNDVDYKQRVMLDTFYVRNWSLWLDFMILLRTVPAVIYTKGAY